MFSESKSEQEIELGEDFASESIIDSGNDFECAASETDLEGVMESSFDENTIPLGDASQIKRGESNKKHSKSSSSQQDFNCQRMLSDPKSKRSNFEI